MEINIRRISKYYTCDIINDSTIMQLGLLDKDECEVLASQFREAANMLFPIDEV